MQMPKAKKKVKKTSKQDLKVTWKDFVPPIVFKVCDYVSKKLNLKNIKLEADTPELLAAIMVFAGIMYGLLGFVVIPNLSAKLAYSITVNDYDIRLNDKALQSYYRYKFSKEKVSTSDQGQYILGVFDSDASTQDTDTSKTPVVEEQKDSTNNTDTKDLMNMNYSTVPAGVYYSYIY